MYYMNSVVLTEPHDTYTMTFMGEGDRFFAEENGFLVAITATRQEGSIYKISKESGELFVDNGYLTVYKVPKFEITVGVYREKVEQIIALAKRIQFAVVDSTSFLTPLGYKATTPDSVWFIADWLKTQTEDFFFIDGDIKPSLMENVGAIAKAISSNETSTLVGIAAPASRVTGFGKAQFEAIALQQLSGDNVSQVSRYAAVDKTIGLQCMVPNSGFDFSC